ncbi:MAG: hypothetical protein ACRDN6_02980 [Gaiellaceae bacterium]
MARRLGALTAAVLVLAPAAEAKLCARIQVTPRPVIAGTWAWIEIRLYEGRWVDGALRPVGPALAGASRDVGVWADGPRGAGDVIRLRASPSDPTLFRARYLFRRAGFWRLEWSEWPWPESPCSGTTGLFVRNP